ncbi:UNVERIFIED_CONTAM: hypothetical protein K2H54_068195, partial [Gekko kuhli]
NFISALYTALGPLLPEVAKLQSHQDPPAHLMVDVKAKLRELGSSVSDARKKLLQYNVYLKKRLARAAQEKKALREQQGVDGSEQELPSLESSKPKPGERVQRRSVRIPDTRLASLGEESTRSLREQAEERVRAYTIPQVTLKSAGRADSLCKSEPDSTELSFSLGCAHQAMEERGSVAPSLPAESPCPVHEDPTCGDEELDEETVNFILAWDRAMEPLQPEIDKLRGHQGDLPVPAHLIVALKAKLQEVGSSVSDAHKKLLQYNIYLELPSPESPKPKPAERVQRRSTRMQDARLASQGEEGSRPLREQAEECPRTYTIPQGTPKGAGRTDSLSSRASSDQSLL